MRIRWFAALLIAFAALALALGRAHAYAQTSPGLLEARLKPILDGHQGKAAIGVKHLIKGESYYRNADEPMPTASLIKFPVMIEAYRQAAEGKLDLKERIELKDSDKVPGSGILTTHFSEGARITVRDAIRLMIAYSDNTATNFVVDKVGLPSTASTMEKLGFPNTKLHSKVFRRDTSIFPERSKTFGLGSTTAKEMIGLLETLHRKALVNAESCDAMIEHMKHCQDENMLPRFLPAGTKTAMKTGAVSDVRTAAGILFTPSGPIAICVLTAQNQDQRWTKDNAAERLVAEAAREVYNHFQQAEDLKAVVGRPVLKLGAAGPEVQTLQRLLNARLSPSPDLQADGEFGPMTESAVIRFQNEKKLKADGMVSVEVWRALGDQVPNEPAVPSPESVNAEGATLPKRPAESLDGPPHATAKAWVIADGETGAPLWGSHDGDSLEIASTTKIMTAYLVLKEAERDPKTLDEVITFSDRADNTPGSTAGVRSGERVTVRELLYGLLLPSGNDAAAAFAEHFGRGLAPKGSDAAADPMNGFVAAMNQAAKDLGLKDTNYENPHGLPAPRHRSTARDLAKLAIAARKLPLFREATAARQRGAALIDSQGHARNVVWKNTNQLLGQEGFDGVKTGTTSGAGACLVATGARGSDRLIVVVLGSSSSDARYSDARNLFRWAWSQRRISK